MSSRGPRWGPDPQTRFDWGIPELTGDEDRDEECLNYETEDDGGDVIMEYFMKIRKKARILELKQRHLKVTVLTSYTPYPSWKIRHGSDLSPIFYLFELSSPSSSFALLFKLPAITLGTVSSLCIGVKEFTLFTVVSNRTLISSKEYPLNCCSV
ncbi:hypothetical protein Tco_1334725 [Tanacetum coccineum]